MTDYVLKAEPGIIYFSPTGFKFLARDYFNCYLKFGKPNHLSVLPYYLCCRAMELSFKSIHLEYIDQKTVKDIFRHDLQKLYNYLPQKYQILDKDEYELLRKINEIYIQKEFEYINPCDFATVFNRFPEISDLEKITKKIIDQNQ